MLRDIIHTCLIKVAGEFTTFYKTVIPLVVLNESIPGGVIAEKHLVACISGGGIYHIIASSIQYIVHASMEFVYRTETKTLYQMSWQLGYFTKLILDTNNCTI